MILKPHADACERARTWAALAPDGELSMLEQRLLQAHTERCAACARVAADYAAIADTLRSAPLEVPTRRLAPQVGRRTAFSRFRGAHAAGRIAAVAAGGFLAFTLGSQSSDEIVGTSPVPPIVIDATDVATIDGEPTELRVYRRAALLSETPAAPALGKHPGPQPL